MGSGVILEMELLPGSFVALKSLLADNANRFCGRTLQGDIRLPDSRTIWADIRRAKAVREAWFIPSDKRYLFVDYIEYMDELGRMIGCTPPNFRKFTHTLARPTCLQLSYHIGWAFCGLIR